MLIQDIKPYTGFSLLFQRDIEPRRIELAKLMGTYKQIEVKTPTEPRKHHRVPRIMLDGRLVCMCADCYGDFSGAGDEEDR